MMRGGILSGFFGTLVSCIIGYIIGYLSRSQKKVLCNSDDDCHYICAKGACFPPKYSPEEQARQATIEALERATAQQTITTQLQPTTKVVEQPPIPIIPPNAVPAQTQSPTTATGFKASDLL